MNLKDLNKKKFIALQDRLVIFMLAISCMFLLIIFQFYKLQILEHDIYDAKLRQTVQKEVEIPAIRGIIYDRYGKTLATNKAIYVLKYDPQITFKDTVERDDVLLKVAKVLEANNETSNSPYIDNVPISDTVPFVFTEDMQGVRRFITNYVPYNDNDHKEIIYTYTAPELIEYLRDELDIDPKFSDEEVRKIIPMRLQIRQTTFQKYKKVTLAQDVSMKSLAAIQENQKEFAGIIAEVESQRYYPYGDVFGNILGYTRTITESQYEQLESQGYEKDDIVGQVGIESEMEADLRGKKGRKLIEVDNVGRTVFTLATQSATAGNDVYLTIDADLQLTVYNALEKRLSEGIIARLQGNSGTLKLTGRDVIVSMAKNNQLDFKIMSMAPETTAQRKLYDKVVASYEAELQNIEIAERELPQAEKSNLTIKAHFANMLDNGLINDTELLLAFGEQGTLQLTEDQMERIKRGNYNLRSLLISQLESGGLKPDQTSIMPCSGTAIVVDPNTGQTLALVSYPSYDNNEFIQNFNSFYTKLHDGIDTRNLEINRALKTAKAPGSTFKMIVGIAGIEEEVVTADEYIYDTGQFTKAGAPYPRCWIFTNTGHGHGNKNVKGALEVSCNYYFYELAYRLGLKYGAPYGGINMLTKYVNMFGLNEKSGIELEETPPNVSNPTTVVNTQINNALKRIRDIKEPTKTELLDSIKENFVLGPTYYETELDEQIDDLTNDMITRLIETDLNIALSNDMELIYNKMLNNYNESLLGGTSQLANEMTQLVIQGDNNLSLKYRTKVVLRNVLNQLTESGTRKTILKSIQKMPQGLVEQAFKESYETMLKRYADEPNMQEVCVKLSSCLRDMRKGKFDYNGILTNKIINGILNVYLNNRFRNIEMEWTVADNVRTAIGQGDNAFTPIQMARYMAGLANGHTVYDLTILSGIKDNKETGEFIEKIPVIHEELNIKQSTIDAVHEGTHLVAKGGAGTARNYFYDFPIEVAVKTGTAQEANWENAWFVGFAPYDHPVMALVTSIYGADGLGAYNTQLARDIFEAYFKIGEEEEKTTLGNHLVE